MDQYLFSKVERMLNWRGVMDQKLDETMASINQLQSCMNKLIAMHKVMAEKLKVIMFVDGNLVSLESIHKSEVQQGQQSPTRVLQDDVGNGGDGTLVRSDFL
jgi:hypothetical protein